MNSATSQHLYGNPQRPVPSPEVQTERLRLDNKLEDYKTRMAKLGKTEIVLGGTICILNLVLLIVGPFHSLSHDMFRGVVLMASGITGVLNHSRLPHRIYLANMVVSMIAAFCMAGVVYYSVRGAINYASYEMPSTEVILESIIALLGFIAFIITMVHFVHSRAGAYNPYGPTEMMMSVQMSNGQVVLFANQTAVNSGTGNPAMVMANQAPDPAQSAESVAPPLNERL